MATTFAPVRPQIMGATHMVSSGHYLASAAGYRILEEGGNAIDAGVAAGIAINVVKPVATNFGGVAPIIIHLAATNKTVTISGLGRWPKAASIDYFESNHGGDLPEGMLRTVTPAAVDAWMTALELYGTMTFEQVVAPARELADKGFPVASSHANIWQRPAIAELVKNWPSTLSIFMPEGRHLKAGELLAQKDLARTFERLSEVERSNAHRGREGAIRAARDFFYKGDIADEIVNWCQQEGGLLTKEDMSEFSVEVEEPVVGSFKEYEIKTCGPWCQGPVVAQTLQMLENDDLAALGHNSPDYIHTVAEALNLAFSDREYYYGDPDFVDVPMNEIMSKAYTRARRGLIDPQRAFGKLPFKGDPRNARAVLDGSLGDASGTGRTGEEVSDTSYACVVDQWGNGFSATPSDFAIMSARVPSLGIVISGRGTSNWMERNHPSSIGPRKRPRLTPNPAMAFKNGKLLMPFGTPGGDVQAQAMVQTFLNIAEFGMDPQAAVDAPRFISWNFPNSFWPHDYLPGKLVFEDGIPTEVISELARRGHDNSPEGVRAVGNGDVCAVMLDHDLGILKGAADHRVESYVIGR